MSPPTTLIAGVGSPFGDDQIGWLVVDALASRDLHQNVVLRKARSPIDLLDWLSGMERLVLCDACRGGGPVGAVRSWMWPTDELQRVAWSGTHDLALPDVLLLADRLNRLPVDVTIWAVESRTSPTDDLSQTCLDSVVGNSVSQVANEISRESARDRPCRPAVVDQFRSIS